MKFSFFFAAIYSNRAKAVLYFILTKVLYQAAKRQRDALLRRNGKTEMSKP